MNPHTFCPPFPSCVVVAKEEKSHLSSFPYSYFPYSSLTPPSSPPSLPLQPLCPGSALRTNSVFLLRRPAFAFICRFLICFAIQEEVVAGDRERAHQDDELGEVHLPVVVGVQVVHHLLNRLIIFGALSEGGGRWDRES